MIASSRRKAAGVLLFLSAALLAAAAAVLPAGQARGRVIVLGFDGADARRVRQMIDAGELPNLARLAREGTFAPLRSTNPAESAAGWAAINTGVGPARNGVPSFFGRTFRSNGMPMPAAFHVKSIERPTSEMEIPGLLGFVAERPTAVVAAIGGALALVVFLLVFKLLLRLRTAIALVLAALFGALGAYGAHRLRGYVPSKVPNVTKNLIEADGFWVHAAERGVRSIVLDAALAFDRPAVENARVLAGLGLPDCRGDIGEWFVYTTDQLAVGLWPNGDSTGTGSGEVFKVSFTPDRFESKIPGPELFWDRDLVEQELAAIRAELQDVDVGWEKSNALRERETELVRELERYDTNEGRATADLVVTKLAPDRVRVEIDGHAQELGPGQWSDWYRVTFAINPLISAHAVTRVRVLEMGETFSLYVNTLDIDPERPPFWQPISQPASFASELVEWTGQPYETVGWACMTNQIKDKKLPIEAFLEDVEFTETWRERLTYAALARDDWELLFSVFTTADRVQHMMYKYTDTEHPKHVPEDAAREITYFGEKITLGQVIPATYRQIDRIVGKVMESMRPDDTLLLCADHGFTSFRRELNVNNWLAEKGYLALRDDLTDTRRDSLADAVDWSRTKAYSLGLGMIFVNQIGREQQGIVPPEEARAVLESIQRDFLALTDLPPNRTEPVRVGHDAVIVADVMQGPYADRCADMMLGLAEYYRVSWDTAGGELDLQQIKDENGVSQGIGLDDVFKDNANNWCGDHASVSPDVVTGIFFTSRPLALPDGGVEVTHVAPTVLALLGLEVPDALYDEKPLPAQ